MHGKQVIKIQQAAGWSITRINGSHHMLKKGNVTVPVPVHGTQDLGIGLLKKIERQTGVKLV